MTTQDKILGRLLLLFHFFMGMALIVGFFAVLENHDLRKQNEQYKKEIKLLENQLVLSQTPIRQCFEIK